jgi:hypothetical protein
MTDEHPGTHRAEIRGLVDAAQGDRDRLIPLLRDWSDRRTETDGADFLLSLMAEFGVPMDAIREAWRDALEKSRGDDELLFDLLREQIDSRENPTRNAAVRRLVSAAIDSALTRVVDEEIERYHGEEPRGEAIP